MGYARPGKRPVPSTHRVVCAGYSIVLQSTLKISTQGHAEICTRPVSRAQRIQVRRPYIIMYTRTYIHITHLIKWLWSSRGCSLVECKGLNTAGIESLREDLPLQQDVENRTSSNAIYPTSSCLGSRIASNLTYSNTENAVQSLVTIIQVTLPST